MNENIVTDASEKKAVFMVRRIMQILSLLCIAFVFCPSFLVSCAGQDAKINVMTAVKGVPGDGEWIAKPKIVMLVCLLIPIVVLVLLFLNKFREKQTVAIIMGCTAVDFVIWLIFRANVKKIAEENLCSFRTTGWYIINLIAMLLIIFLATLVFFNVMTLDTDLIAFFSGGGTRNALNQISGTLNQMSSTVTKLAGNVATDINNNKVSKTPVPESLLTEEETVKKVVEEASILEKEIEQKASEETYDMPEKTKSVAEGLCVECGAQLRDNVKFCTKCGTRIKPRKIDIDRQNSGEVLGKNIPIQMQPIQSQRSVEKISGKQINKIALAAIAVIVISAIAGGIVYTRTQRTNTENIENIVDNMQDLPKQQEGGQFVPEIVEANNVEENNEVNNAEVNNMEGNNTEANEAQNAIVETQNKSKEAPQIIQLDSRYISSIQASSELTDSTKTYKVESVLDKDKETCWSEGADGIGEGEFIYIEFTSPVYISEVAFLNGYMKNENVYNANGKIKSIELMFDNENYDMEFIDWQYQEIQNALYSDRFTLDIPVRTQSLAIMILEAQKGTKYDDTCLTELAIWGYEDDTDGDTSAAVLPAGGEKFDIYALYGNVIDEVAFMYGSDCEYALYDFDHDGTVELITSQGTSNADWSNTVYTVDNNGMLAEIGTFYGMISLYAAENGNGIYSVYGHMGYQEVQWITKKGNELHVETILSGETEEYYENDNPIPMVGIDEDIMNY